ncbi:hypothetical protein ACVW00_002380 [Marmoricola sp. URHA0025 HA25]
MATHTTRDDRAWSRAWRAVVLLLVLSAPLCACSSDETGAARGPKAASTGSLSDDDRVVPPRELEPVDVARSLAAACSTATLNRSGLSHQAAVELSTFSEDTLDPANALLTPRDRKIVAGKAFRSRFLRCFSVAYEPTSEAAKACERQAPPSEFTRASVAEVCHAAWTVVLSTGGELLRVY